MTSGRLAAAVAVLDDVRRSRVGDPASPPTLDLTGPQARPTWQTSTSTAAEWTERALSAVRATALRCSTFTVDDVGADWPATYDARSRGTTMRTAAKRGWIQQEGWTSGGSGRHGKPITRWRSLICTTHHESRTR